MNLASTQLKQNAQENFQDREFPMTDADFSRIQSLAYSLSGIKLADHKKSMIYGRLARRVRALSLVSFSQYCEVLSSNGSAEITNFVNAITTNLTSFFREGHHFEYLEKNVFPFLLNSNPHGKRARIWSAGCSTGEEAYSIAMVVKSFRAFSNWDVKILATDLDSNVVEKARAGVYSIERVERIPKRFEHYLQVSTDKQNVKVKSSVADLVTFKQLNLLQAWPMKGPFDVIFCRNVVIYFDSDTQKVLFDRYADILNHNAHLFIGHSENLHKISDRYDSLGRTVYQRRI